MRMQAAILTEAQTPFRIETVHLDPPKDGEVLIKMAAAGICHSDWHSVDGKASFPAPIILGHEGAGIVQSIGKNVSRVQPGDHVTLSWKACCGLCFYCQNSMNSICPAHKDEIAAGLQSDGTTRVSWNDQPLYVLAGIGTFAEYAVARQESCVPIRKDIPLDVAALVGCAVSTGVGAALYTAKVRPGQSVAVYGAGGVGLNIIQGAALCGAHPIIAIDLNSSKMRLAREFGATHTLFSNDNTISEIQNLTHGRGADHVFESVGIPALQETALQATRPGGLLTIVGITPENSKLAWHGNHIISEEKRICGCYYGSINPNRDFHLFLDLYRAGKLKLEELITRRWQLNQINEAYADMLTGTVARGVIIF